MSYDTVIEVGIKSEIILKLGYVLCNQKSEKLWPTTLNTISGHYTHDRSIRAELNKFYLSLTLGLSTHWPAMYGQTSLPHQSAGIHRCKQKLHHRYQTLPGSPHHPALQAKCSRNWQSMSC